LQTKTSKGTLELVGILAFYDYVCFDVTSVFCVKILSLTSNLER